MKKMFYKGVSTHNLKQISVNIPQNKLTCIAGVSGSGKSSLAFSTIAAISLEEYRRLTSDQENEQDYIVDEYGDIPMAIPLRQLNFNVNPRSTIATYFGLQRSLNYIIATLSGLKMNFLNFNGDGHCTECMGLGYKKTLNTNNIIKWDTKIKDIPFECWLNSYKDFYKKLLIEYCKEIDVDLEKNLTEIPKEKRDLLIRGIGKRKYTIQYKYGGSIRRKTTCYYGPCIEIGSNKQFFPTLTFDLYMKNVKCPACEGCRLRNKISNIRIINNIKISDIETTTFYNLISIIEQLASVDKNIIKAVNTIKIFIKKAIQLGLGHLSLARGIPSLSGGELQRLRLTQILSGNLADILIILDEPTASLHPSESVMVAKEISNLKKNNTVIVIDHHVEILKYADNVVYLGPQGGNNGGNIISQKEFQNIISTNSYYNFIEGTNVIVVNPFSEYVTYHGKINIHMNSLNVICGSSGSGKSIIIHDILQSVFHNYIDISQRPIKGNRNSTVGTYTKLSDEIRHCYAEKFKKDKLFFSKNGPIGCKHCKGNGYISIGEYFGKSITTVCGKCFGTGYNSNVEDYKINNISIVTAAKLPLSNLKKHLQLSKKALKTLSLMEAVHLGYLSLERNISSLSGGENQRIKLVMALTVKKNMIIGLDEPVKGLSPKEIDNIINILYSQIKQNGNTFIVSEHNTQFINAASYISELVKYGNYTEIVYSNKREGINKCRKSIIKDWLPRI